MKYKVTMIVEVDNDTFNTTNNPWEELSIVEELVDSAIYDLTDMKLLFTEVEKDD